MTNLKCAHGEHYKKYNVKYDSFYCELCNQWLTQGCGCAYCRARPEKPINITIKSTLPINITTAPVISSAPELPHICFKDGVWNNFLRSMMFN